MEINLPDVLAEVEAAFRRYEDALNANDVASLNELFWRSPTTIRYADGESYGHEAIAAARAARDPATIGRELLRAEITSYGRDFATASCEFRRKTGQRGRQQQTWMRTTEGWRVVAAHVSLKA